MLLASSTGRIIDRVPCTSNKTGVVACLAVTTADCVTHAHLLQLHCCWKQFRPCDTQVVGSCPMFVYHCQPVCVQCRADRHGMQELHGLKKSCRPCKRLCSSTAKKTGQSDGLQLRQGCLAALTRMSSASTPTLLHGKILRIQEQLCFRKQPP